MDLETWRKTEKISYEKLSKKLNTSTIKIFRICKKKGACIRLSEAYAIVKLTNGAVSFEDLLDNIDC